MLRVVVVETTVAGGVYRPRTVSAMDRNMSSGEIVGMNFTTRVLALGGLMVSLSCWAVTSAAAEPTPEVALGMKPVQAEVEVGTPTADEAANCKLRSLQAQGQAGWELLDGGGLTLRRFLDTNADGSVDLWCYYKDGLEVYRDIDGDFNGRADQYRWFHTGGSRWGLDTDEDKVIDAWKAISAEEVTAEVVGALASGDIQRFSRVTLTDAELKSLGLGATAAQAITAKLDGIDVRFGQLAREQQVVRPSSKWLQFSGNRPGTVPAGKDGATKDLHVYENVVAIVETDGDHAQVQFGTLIRVGDVWRVIDLPDPIEPGQTELTATGFFFPVRREASMESMVGQAGTSEAYQRLVEELRVLDDAHMAKPTNPAIYHANRADLIEKIAEAAPTDEDHRMWIYQLVDTVGAAAQSGEYPGGVQRLGKLADKLLKTPSGSDMAAHVHFVLIAQWYNVQVTGPKPDYEKIQKAYLQKLEQFVTTFPTCPDAAEAVLQIAITQEYAGQEAEAKKWYARIAEDYPTSRSAAKANGALTRLSSVGKAIRLQGKSSAGKQIDLAKYLGHVVLIQYWASWASPCKTDVPVLRDLASRYRQKGFYIIGVNLDNSEQEMSRFVQQYKVDWPQIHEEGGLDSRPANEMGILTLPTMILVDQKGRVVNRNVLVADLDSELNKLIR